MVDLDDEAERATTLLRGKQVAEVWRHRTNEVAVQFTDGTRLFADTPRADIELSITSDNGEPDRRAASRPETVELLTRPFNGAVVQLPDRRYPGVVIQGDSLSTICEHLGEAIDGGAVDLAGVKADLDNLLRGYLDVLEARSITPPFSYRPTTT